MANYKAKASALAVKNLGITKVTHISGGKPFKSRKVQKPTKLRESITPGTVLILLHGVHKGKRVVFLKQLASGNLLVVGPYKVNRVPLMSISQAFVIATSTKVDISSVKVSEKVNDEIFKSEKKKVKKEFLAESKESKKQVPAEILALTVEVDTQLLPIVKQTPLLKSYLGSFFTIKKGQAPHLMKF